MMPSVCAEDDIAQKWKNPVWVMAQRKFSAIAQRKFSRNRKDKEDLDVLFADDPAVPVSEGRPRRAVSPFCDGDDFAFASNDLAGRPDHVAEGPHDALDGANDLGGWLDHVAEERRDAQSLGAHLVRGSGRQRGRGAEYSFPADAPGNGWLNTARSCGASDDQISKSAAMMARGLGPKAKRQAFCRVVGAQYVCASFEPGRPSGHKFFRPYSCRNRYCGACGPALYRDLFFRYAKLESVASRLAPDTCRHRGRSHVIAKIDFTVRSLGRMPRADEVRQFNRCVKHFWRLVESELCIDRRAYGAIWADEFGGDNCNLHSHAMYVLA